MTAITGKPAKIYTAYFSPTGGTKKAALALTSALADTDGFTEIDLSLPALAQYTFAADDIIVVAVPVFGGRVPAFCTAAADRSARSEYQRHCCSSLWQPRLRRCLAGAER